MTTDNETREQHAARIAFAKATIVAAEDALAKARLDLEDVLAAAHADGLSYRQLADLAGFGHQHTGDLILASQQRAADATAA